MTQPNKFLSVMEYTNLLQGKPVEEQVAFFRVLSSALEAKLALMEDNRQQTIDLLHKHPRVPNKLVRRIEAL